MITFRYIDPETNELITKSLDDSVTDPEKFFQDFHKILLEKQINNKENCKIWIKIHDEFIIVGV